MWPLGQSHHAQGTQKAWVGIIEPSPQISPGDLGQASSWGHRDVFQVHLGERTLEELQATQTLQARKNPMAQAQMVASASFDATREGDIKHQAVKLSSWPPGS